MTAAQLADLADVVLGDLEAALEDLAATRSRLSALRTGLVALREQAGGGAR
ncbi:hypothetical protein [Jiangella muralis]|uniref:hypothetical protein n=1 Tax=Jiangella muralis TaxID=702383 RepID=UPI0012FC353E|nr:hypothetical protein [Jiangella muralis]